MRRKSEPQNLLKY